MKREKDLGRRQPRGPDLLLQEIKMVVILEMVVPEKLLQLKRTKYKKKWWWIQIKLMFFLSFSFLF